MSAVEGAVTRALWLDRFDPPITPRPPLGADRQYDVAIVGGGFSGLWTAYYLIRTDPTLRIAVLERDFCGFGASGRNGGWAVGELAGGFNKYARLSSPAESLRLARAVFDAVDEIGTVTTAEGIECDYAKGGTVRVARNTPQARRQRDEVDEAHEQGFTEDELRLLTAAEAQQMLNASKVKSGVFFAATAAVDPAKLVRGLAQVVEDAGVRIFEQTPVTEIRKGEVVTTFGAVHADAVVRATEAYSRDLPGAKRDLLPVYSFMIATEPLAPDVIAEIGLEQRPTFADDRYMVIYGQRTADDRIAFGGRGIPYLYGSRISAANETRLATHTEIHRILTDLIPALSGAAITHRWGGVLAAPRNWTPGLTYDQSSGLGVLGGYVGEGVAPSNLAGRTMADLILGHETDRTSLAWVGAKNRRWEPEPLRFVGVRSSRWLLHLADRREDKTDRESRWAYHFARLLRGDR